MKYFKFLVFILTAVVTRSQEVELKDLKVPSSPAFSLLDFSPQVIESPGNIKAFTLSLLSNTAESNGLPRNFAFEFAPYWFFRHPKMNVFKYFGLSKGNDREGDFSIKFKPDIFYGLRSTSLSLGSVFKDSSEMNPFNLNYIGYSLRSNIINVRSALVNKALYNSVTSVNAALQRTLLQAIAACGDKEGQERIDCIGEFISTAKDSLLNSNRENFFNLLNVRPLFSVDIALASSTVFRRNNWNEHNRYRTGAWITMGYNQPLIARSKVEEDIKNLLECKNYVNAVIMIRTLKDNTTLDFENFTEYNVTDLGGRIEFEFNKLSLGIESIRRINNDNKDFNTNRTVGIIQYKINDQLFLLGTFGKNFGDFNNLVSLIGLNWGLGKNALYNRFE